MAVLSWLYSKTPEHHKKSDRISSSEVLLQMLKNMQVLSCNLKQVRLAFCCDHKENVRKPEDKKEKNKAGITGKANFMQHKTNSKDSWKKSMWKYAGPRSMDEKDNYYMRN